jgi:SAM-dependent methyltransferase
MLAPRQVPEPFRRWNASHGAPHGRSLPYRLTRILPETFVARLQGPFSIQANNTIREFEYPWVYETASLRPGAKVLEIGGGLSGLQFVIERSGAHVVNVDPGMAAAGIGWPCDAASMERLNRLFGARVDLRNTTIDRADLAPNSFDAAISVSVLEHLPDDDLRHVMARVYEVLRPGGVFVITLDLFLEVEPFTRRRECKYGRNINVRELIGMAPFVLEQGRKDELYGFDAFDAEAVLSNLSRYYVGAYPALAQCLTLRKPG